MRQCVVGALAGVVYGVIALSSSAAAASTCPPGGGWQLIPTDGDPFFEANDRNGDGYLCGRFYDNEHVPHRLVFTDNR